MAKTALIILAEGFEEVEAVGPVDFLRRAGVRITIAGLKDLKVKGSRHITLEADILLRDFKEMPDAILLPGGAQGATNLAASAEVAAWVKKMSAAGKIVAAICAAPAEVLAPLGILDGKKATCYPGCESDFSKTTVHSKARVVEDGDIITSQGPGTALEFAFAIAARLVGKEMAETVRDKMLMAC
jgi:4-methyl-5(b-hydroxyethyl)-thiazole monophosphate biosynthesis